MGPGDVLATCLDCGDVHPEAIDVRVVLLWDGRPSAWHFCCPGCGRTVRRAMPDPTDAGRLIKAGARPHVVDKPDELTDEQRTSTRGAMTTWELGRCTSTLKHPKRFADAVKALREPNP